MGWGRGTLCLEGLPGGFDGVTDLVAPIRAEFDGRGYTKSGEGVRSGYPTRSWTDADIIFLATQATLYIEILDILMLFVQLLIFSIDNQYLVV